MSQRHQVLVVGENASDDMDVGGEFRLPLTPGEDRGEGSRPWKWNLEPPSP